MEICYASNKLKQLAETVGETGGFSPAVVKAYRKRIQTIDAAVDERDFYGLKSLHYEKLKGKRKHQRSMKINDQMRLVIEITKSTPKNIVHVIAIEDYH